MSLTQRFEKEGIDPSFSKIDIDINGRKLKLDFGEILYLAKDEEEFYSPEVIGEKIAEIAYYKDVLYSAFMDMVKLRRRTRHEYEVLLARARIQAEDEILEKRKEQAGVKLRDKVGGQVTQQQIDDWVKVHVVNENEEFANLWELEVSYKWTCDDCDLLEEKFKELVSRSIELNKLADIAMQEWRNTQTSIKGYDR